MLKRKLLYLLSASVFLAISIFSAGCGEQEKDIAGTWELETINGEPLFSTVGEETKSYTSEWEFNGEEWNWTTTINFEIEGYLITVRIIINGVYIVFDSEITITCGKTSFDVTLPEELKEMGLSEKELEDEIEKDFEGPDGEIKGEYSISGDSLTITTTDGDIIVLKRKG